MQKVTVKNLGELNRLVAETREKMPQQNDGNVHGEMPNWDCSAQMQACLDTPAPRVVGPGDVVIPAAVMTIALCDADFVAKSEAITAQHFPELAADLEAGNT